MKNYKTILGAVVAILVLSVASSEAQLNLTGGSLVGSLPTEKLIGISGGPPALPVDNVGMNDGTISTWVVSDSTLDSQGLIFVYQVVNNGPDAIDQVELTGFASGQVISTGQYTSVTGLTLTGSASPGGPAFGAEDTFGGTATFENGNLATAMTASDYLVVYTDVSNFSTDYGQIQDSFSAEGGIYAPAVPEANTIMAGMMMIVPLAFGAVRAIRRDRGFRI